MKRVFLILFMVFTIHQMFAQSVWPEPVVIAKNVISNILSTIEIDDGVMIVYKDYIDGQSNINIQRINSNGSVLWSTQLFIDSISVDISEIKLIRTSDSCYFMVWTEAIDEYSEIDPFLNAIYSLKFQADGQLLFPKTAISNENGYYGGLELVRDTAGGYYVSYNNSLGNSILQWKIKHVSAINQSELGDNDVIVSSLQGIRPIKLTYDDSNNLIFFYSQWQRERHISKIYVAKITQSTVAFTDVLIDTTTYESNMTWFINDRFDIIKLNNEFIISSGRTDTSSTLKAYNNNFDLLWKKSYGINTDFQTKLQAIDSSNFVFLYRENSNVIKIKKIDQTGTELNEWEYNTLGYQSETVSCYKYDNNMYIKILDRFSDNPAENPPNNTYKHIILDLNLSTMALNSMQIPYLSSYNFNDYYCFSSNLLYSFDDNPLGYEGYSFNIIDLPANNSVFFQSDFLENGNYGVLGYNSIKYQNKNLIRFTNKPGFYLVDPNGINSLYGSNVTLPIEYKVNDMMNVFDDKILVNTSTKATSSLHKPYPVSMVSLLSPNNENQSVTVYNSTNSFIEKDTDFCWAAIEGTHISGDGNMRYTNLYKFSNSNTIIDSTEIVTGSTLVGMEGKYLFYLDQTVLKVIKFNNEAQISENWNANGTAISNSVSNSTGLQILATKETPSGLLIIWKEYNLGVFYINAILLNSDNGQLINSTPQVVYQANNLLNDCKAVIQDNKFFVAICYSNSNTIWEYLSVRAYSLNDNILTMDWERNTNDNAFESSFYKYDMELINNKLIFVFGKSSRVFMKTLSLVGNPDQFNSDGYTIKMDNKYVQNDVKIIPSDDTHIFVNWNASSYAFYSQYINVSEFVETNEVTLPENYISYHKNYPNPFNPNTIIEFAIPKKGKTEVSVYNLKGQKVKNLCNKELEKGVNRLNWNGKDSDGKSVSTGLYFYRIKTAGGTQIGKMTLLK